MTQTCPRCGEQLKKHSQSNTVTRWDCPEECNVLPGVVQTIREVIPL